MSSALTRAEVKKTLAKMPPLTKERVDRIMRILEGGQRHA